MATFVGRTRELAELGAALARGSGEPVVVWGPAGVGKTRLVQQWADTAPRAVCLCDLSDAQTSDAMIVALAAAACAPLQEADGLDAVRRVLVARNAVLVGDGVDRLEAAALHELAGLAAEVPVVLTCRSRPALADATTIAIGPLDEVDAIALLSQLGGASIPPATQAAIVERLDRLPLAIALAAARLPLLGPSELALRLSRSSDFLRDDGRADERGRTRPARHATLRAAMDWSWDFADDEDRRALAALACFEGAFDGPLAEAVLEEASTSEHLHRLERLRHGAWLEVQGDDPPRLRLLTIVREFVRESAPASAQGRRRHADAVLARAEPLAEAVFLGAAVPPALRDLRADLLAVASRPGDGETAARAVLALAPLLGQIGPVVRVVSLVDAVVADPAVTTQTRARLALARAEASRALGDVDAIEPHVRLAEGLVATLPSDARPALAIEVDRALGRMWRLRGDFGRALDATERALVACKVAGDLGREAGTRVDRGAVHQSAGRHREARAEHQAAAALHAATGTRRAEGLARSHLAVATHRHGDVAAARIVHEQARAIHREVGDTRLEGAELLHLGFVHHELGEPGPARVAFTSARELLRAVGARGLEAMCLTLWARLEVDEGRFDAARTRLAEARVVLPTGWRRVGAMRALVEGHLAMAERNAEAAVAAYRTAIATSGDVEVGFEALTPAYLALATRRLDTAASVSSLVADAKTAVSAVDNPLLASAIAIVEGALAGHTAPVRPGIPSSDVRRLQALVGSGAALRVSGDGSRMVLADGRTVDLGRRQNVRRILVLLVAARRDAPGRAVAREQVLAAGWPGEKMSAEAATKRLHTAIWTLRSLGLGDWLVTSETGYCLDGSIPLLDIEV